MTGKTKKLVVLAVAVVLIGSMVLANVPPSTQQGQLRSSGGAPAHVTLKQYLAEGTSEKSSRVVEVSPYCVPDWAVAGQWTLSVTQPFKLEGLPFFAKKFGNPGEDARLGREFALLVSINPDDPESVLGEASNIDNGERMTENIWLEFAEGVDLEPGDYFVTLLFGPDYLDGKLDATYNATVSLDKETQTPAWGRFLEGNVKVTRKSELLTLGKLSFPLKIDQNVTDHSLTECQQGDWVALTDDEYYGVQEEIVEEEELAEKVLGEEEWLEEDEWSEDEWGTDFGYEGGWAEEVEEDGRSENLLQNFGESVGNAVWVEEESVDAGAGESEVEAVEEKNEPEPLKIEPEPLKVETKQEEPVKPAEPTKTSTSGGGITTTPSTQETKLRNR